MGTFVKFTEALVYKKKKLWTFSHLSSCTFVHNVEILLLLQIVEEKISNDKETSLNQDFEFCVVFIIM